MRNTFIAESVYLVLNSFWIGSQSRDGNREGMYSVYRFQYKANSPVLNTMKTVDRGMRQGQTQ